MTTLRAGLVGLLFALGCSHAPGKVMGDTMMWDTQGKKWVPLIEYKAPDIDEITGIDSEAEPTPPAETPPAAAPAPAAEAAPAAPAPAVPAGKGTPAAQPGAKTSPPAKK